MQFRIVHLFKNGCSWNPWAGGTLLVPQFVVPYLLHKNDQTQNVYLLRTT